MSGGSDNNFKSGPSGIVLPNAVVAQFEHLNEEVVPFLDAFPRSVAIPFAEHEWRHNSDVYNRKQFFDAALGLYNA